MESVVYNDKAEKIGTVDLPQKIFGVKWNPELVHQVIVSYMANRRVKGAHVKDRSLVSGGGRKPWRQKGTGRARHGSIRSPLWKGGGVTHGPAGGRNLKKKINKKMAEKALYTVLSAKARDREIVVVDSIAIDQPKTSLGALMFKNFSALQGLEISKKGKKALVIIPKKNDALLRTLRNLPYAHVHEARNLNAYEALRYKYIFFLKEALGTLNRAG